MILARLKIFTLKSAYYSICDDYVVIADETWMHGNWFYTTKHGIFGYGRKATKSLHQTILQDG